MNKYYVYCYNEEGKHSGKTEMVYEELFEWLKTNLYATWSKIIVTDEDDFCVIEVIENKIVFPPAYVKAQKDGLI